MSPDPKAPEEPEAQFRQAADDLVVELAIMHATLFTLIAMLRSTDLSTAQRALIDEASADLRKSQKRFLGQYAEKLGGAAPENN